MSQRPTEPDHRGELFAALQRLLPQHILSRLLGRIAESEHPRLKGLLIRRAVARYGIDLAEAQSANPDDYPSFNHFFTRYLKTDVRPVSDALGTVVSPADGTISQLGSIHAGNIFQAKGHSFSTASLLALDAERTARFDGGSFATVYLSPRDYHRVHMPYPGTLLEARYIPGRLFSVNHITARHIPGLFARNERLVCLFDTDCGLMAVVLVGAIFVAGIGTVWRSHYPPGQIHYERFAEPRHFNRGEELGVFRFGSTVVLAFERHVDFVAGFGHGAGIRMGARLGDMAPPVV